MVQELEQVDIFGRLGKGLGEGLAEQLPKEFGRKRLERSLASLREEAKAPGASPIDLAFRSLALPELTPELQRNALPFLMSLLARKESRGLPTSLNEIESGIRVPGGSVDTPNEFRDDLRANEEAALGRIPSNELPSGYSSFEEARSLSPKNPQESYLPKTGYFSDLVTYQLTPEQFERSADYLYQNYPSQFQSIDEARQRIASLQAQEAQGYEIASKEFSDALQNLLQKNPQLALNDLSGSIYQKFKDKAYTLGRKTGNYAQAAREVAEKARNFANDRDNLKSVPYKDLLNRGADKALIALTDKYKEFGAEDLAVKDLMTSFNISEQDAKSFVYPLSEPVKSVIEKIPKFDPIGRGFVGKSADFNKRTQTYIETALDKIQPDDSLFSVVDAFRRKGINENLVIDTIQERGSFLSPLQKEEVGKLAPRPSRFSLDTFFWDSFIGNR